MTSLLNRLMLYGILALLFSISTNALAQDTTEAIEDSAELNQEQALSIQPAQRDLYWGFRIGQGIAYPDINIGSTALSNDDYTNDTQVSAAQGAVFVEKQLHPYFYISAGVELDYSTRAFVDEDASASTVSTFLGAGFTIGNISKPRSPYFSVMVGPGYTLITDTGDPDAEREPCLAIVCFVDYQDKLGASASGIGHRVEIGMAVTPRFRVALSQSVIGGDADDLVSGSTAYTRYANLSISVALR